MAKIDNKKTCVKFKNFIIIINRKKVKYLRLKVSDEGEISISAPLRANLAQIYEFIAKNEIWLIKTIAKFTQNDGKVSFKGKKFDLVIDKDAKFTQVLDDKIIAKSKFEFDKFIKNEANIALLGYIDKFLPFVNKPVNHISIKKMRTRWGSCNTKKGYINLNLNLIAKDPKFAEYVVLHELTHLIFPHHKKSFYEFIAKIMPDFKKRLKL